MGSLLATDGCGEVLCAWYVWNGTGLTLPQFLVEQAAARLVWGERCRVVLDHELWASKLLSAWFGGTVPDLICHNLWVIKLLRTWFGGNGAELCSTTSCG